MPSPAYETRTIITDAGRSQAHIAYQSGFKIVIKTFKVGDGALPGDVDPPTNSTDLGNVVWPPAGPPNNRPNGFPITAYQWLPNQLGLFTILEIMCQLPPTDPDTGDPLGPFTINEVGLYLEDGTLFCLAYFPDFPKLANQNLVIRVQFEIANADSIFEFDGSVAQLDLYEQFAYVFAAGMSEIKVKWHLHGEIARNRTRIDSLETALADLDARFQQEHNLPGTHRPLVARRSQVNELWDAVRGTENGFLTEPEFGGVGAVTYYVNSLSGDDANSGLSTGAPKKTLAKLLAELDDKADVSYFIALFGNPGSISGEDSGETGDGVVDTFTFKTLGEGTIPSTMIRPGTVSINAVCGGINRTINDDSYGDLIGYIGAGTNRIDYRTGDVDVTFLTPPDPGEPVYISYGRSCRYRLTKQAQFRVVRSISFAGYSTSKKKGGPSSNWGAVIDCDFQSTFYISGLSAGLLAKSSQLLLRNLTVMSPYTTGPTTFAQATGVAVINGGNLLAEGVRFVTTPTADESYEATPTDSDNLPLVFVGPGSSASFKADSDSGQDCVFRPATFRTTPEKSTAIFVRGGGFVFAEDTEFIDAWRCVDNEIDPEGRGGILDLDAATLTYTTVHGPESTPRIGFDDQLTVRNVDATGSTFAIDLYDTGGGFVSPLTTKGDIYVRDAAVDTRLPVGADDQVLIADSTQATGLRWGTFPDPRQDSSQVYSGANADVNGPGVSIIPGMTRTFVVGDAGTYAVIFTSPAHKSGPGGFPVFTAALYLNGVIVPSTAMFFNEMGTTTDATVQVQGIVTVGAGDVLDVRCDVPSAATTVHFHARHTLFIRLY